MTRSLSAAVAFAVLALAGAASAQTWGQPVYLNAYGRPVGGTPLSEVESRSYIATGRWADGYSDRPQVYVPAPGYGLPHPARGHDYGYGRRQDSHHYGYGTDGYGHGHGHNAPRRRSDHAARTGYRDVWGYNDDRPPSARGWTDDRHGRRYGRDCGCGDVYLYDR